MISGPRHGSHCATLARDSVKTPEFEVTTERVAVRPLARATTRRSSFGAKCDPRTAGGARVSRSVAGWRGAAPAAVTSARARAVARMTFTAGVKQRRFSFAICKAGVQDTPRPPEGGAEVAEGKGER